MTTKDIVNLLDCGKNPVVIFNEEMDKFDFTIIEKRMKGRIVNYQLNEDGNYEFLVHLDEFKNENKHHMSQNWLVSRNEEDGIETYGTCIESGDYGSGVERIIVSEDICFCRLDDMLTLTLYSKYTQSEFPGSYVEYLENWINSLLLSNEYKK